MKNKIKKHHVLIFITLAGLVFIASCASKKNAVEKDKRYKVKKGDLFKIKLNSNPTTGYKWMLSEPIDTTIVKFDNKDYKSSTGKSDKIMLGGGGEETWIFKTIGKGKTKIKLKYARSWEQQDSAIRQETFHLKVK
ncbi:MAG: hypothetical protein CSB01_00620 [Bacteroidia bacterium]|nr:MAG: hypothetical protein CSB01_00620 [Bacteroidia bacterium]